MSTPTKKIDPHRRAGRVAARIREELAVLLGREFDDPRLVPVVVGEVRVTDDLSQARIRFAVLGDDPKGIRRKQAGRRLKALVPALRAKLAPRLEMRRVPDLLWDMEDTTPEDDRIDSLLLEVAQELKKPA